MTRLRVALAQVNPTVGAITANVERLARFVAEAQAQECDLVAFGELAISGYPPEDLLLKPAFVADNQAALDGLVASTAGAGTAVVVGFVDGEAGSLRNAAALVADGKIRGVYHKRLLPNYAVFDENRYFRPGDEALALDEVRGVRVGMTVCEDAWFAGGPIHELGDGGAELIVNLNGSPYHAGKVAQREEMLVARAREAGCPIVYVNQVGGQDELVFDGASVVVGANGEVLARAAQYREQLLVVDVDVPERPLDPERSLPVRLVPLPVATPRRQSLTTDLATPLPPLAEVYGALVLGTHDYVTKNGFSDVVIGLSGGIDSSLVATIAVDALGPDRVHGVLMPSRYSSEHSLSDAEALARNLGIDWRVIPIEPAHATFVDLLAPSFEGREEDLTEENIQSRIRGVLLMALSNKFGWMVLTTSNKSESAVGYSTLYGDSAGGFAVIKDVPKLLVFELCRRRNRTAGYDLIPEAVITKPPSAELRPGQTDEQSLPPYEVLDPILEAYVEDDRTAAELIGMGFDADLVRRITRLVDVAEYKRRQFPPGVRITTKAFGKDRRLPITNGYRG